jgi:hypothetical protein
MANEVAKPRRSYGVISVMLALITFSVAMTATMIAVQTSKAGPIFNVIFPIFVVLVGFAAPVAHAIGVALGVAAIVRPGDRRGLGILGAVLNTLAIATGIGLAYLAVIGLGGVR